MDRKGHDRRYAIAPTKIHQKLGGLIVTSFDEGIKRTVKWYLEHHVWWEHIISGMYQAYYQEMHSKKDILEFAKI